MKNYKLRTESINQQLRYLGADITVSHMVVGKQNTSYEGYALKSNNSNTAPIVPIKEEWDDFSDTQLAKILIEYYECNQPPEFDLSILSDDYIYSHVKPLVVGTNNNHLSDLEFHSGKFLDLTIYYYIDIDRDNMIRITKKMMQVFNLDEDMLHNNAINNVMFNNTVYQMPIINNSNKMLVLSTKNKVFGASAILCNTLLNKACKAYNTDKIIILPSSIHELICVPYYNSDINYLKNMVTDINKTLVDEYEILTNSVYMYDSINKKVEIIA